MSEAPLVSVLVPSYNHGIYLADRISSICLQTYSNFELLVIDDSSNDESVNILRELSNRFDFELRINKANSGSPFTAWESLLTEPLGEYVWICESDDVAEENFLEVAVKRLQSCRNAAIFYSNSHVIDSNSDVIGSTSTYFSEGFWSDKRWSEDFSVGGASELRDFQCRGQTVPNMSSALIRASAFKSAFTPFVKRLHLTGDWLFIGYLMSFGGVEFSSKHLSRFRQHEVTARSRVNSARSQAEFFITKYRLYRLIQDRKTNFADFFSSDVVRFIYEPASPYQVVSQLFKISVRDTLGIGLGMLFSVVANPALFRAFLERRRHAAELLGGEK